MRRKRLFRRRLSGLIPLGVDREAADEFGQICEVVAQRKRQFYPRLSHLIVDVQLKPDETGVNFDVACAVNPDRRL